MGTPQIVFLFASSFFRQNNPELHLSQARPPPLLPVDYSYTSKNIPYIYYIIFPPIEMEVLTYAESFLLPAHPNSAEALSSPV